MKTDLKDNKNTGRELMNILQQYQGDRKRALKEHPSLPYLYALSDQREDLLEWYPFRADATLLQVGSDYGTLTGLYSRKVSSVDVIDTDEEDIEVNRYRHVTLGGCTNINYYNCDIQDNSCGKYDYIVFAGSLDKDGEGHNGREEIAKARKLLKDGGTIIIASCNPFGMKYWAGAKRDDKSLSKRDIEKLFKDTDGYTDGELKFYYPMPDYKIPVTIFSDEHLPSKGELTDTVTAYDYPEYLMMDIGEAYDMVCEDGQFDNYANSYLAFWTSKNAEKTEESLEGSKDPEQDLLAEYIKYNRTRRDKFQIRTAIYNGRYGRYVEKTPLSKEGVGFVDSFEEYYESLCGAYDGVKFLKPEYKYLKESALESERTEETAECTEGTKEADNIGVVFQYISGRSLAEQLGEEIKDGRAPVEMIRSAMDKILSVRDEAVTEFKLIPEFLEVFGDTTGLKQMKKDLARADGRPEEDYEKYAEEYNDRIWGRFTGVPSYTVTNLDSLFENMMILTDDSICAIDYEWVFSFPIPADFVRYRILFYAYRMYQSLLKGYPALDDWLSEFGISPDDAKIYNEMEISFQQYVHGENQQIYLENYLVKTKTVKELAHADTELSLAKDRVNQLNLQLREKDTEIRKITEVQRLTNNHVSNLEVIIGDQRHEIDEMGKTLTYLNRHEALLSKARRKAGEKFNEMYPKGSEKRKKLVYAKEYINHPIRSAKFYSSEEGKNIKDGDFAIGSIYKEHGRLNFPKADDPLVSIVIPTYNQIEYTYKCLLSILEYSSDVNYEIIIADDVSTDATKDLEKYVTGVTVCRGETNQGFLKNCNNAASKARGRYIMFLNNDTQVTDHWLSSLVDLIESDDTIGMVGSKLVFPDGKLQEAGGIIWSDGSGWNYGRGDDPEKPEYNYVKDVDYISGAAILISKALWDQIGGFDERYVPAYCEDSDLAFEVRKAGYRVVYQPLSKVIHYEGISNGTDVEGSGMKHYQVENSKKLKEKWAGELIYQCDNNGNPDPFRARERSMGRKIILVIDHYVPTYDKDAGSKTTFQYLKMFLEKGYVVKFLGDNFLHEEPYSTTLEQMGIEILYGAEYQTKIWDWLKDHGDDLTAVYLNRPHIATKYIDFIKENTSVKTIYYGHDLHFLREGREYALTGDLEVRQSAEYWKAVEMSLMYKADVSYYPSEVECEAIKAEDEDINVKAIVAYVYEKFRDDIPEDFAKREGILFVGGFAHPPNADAVIWFVNEIYPLFKNKMEERGLAAPDFIVVGSHATDEIEALQEPGNGVIIKGYVSEEELARLYDTTRITAVPLRYGAGVKGKVVEALYYGSPIVTTAIGAEGIPEAESVMEIADNPDTFAGALAELYSDPERCADMSKKSQEYIRAHYSVDAAWDIIKEDF